MGKMKKFIDFFIFFLALADDTRLRAIGNHYHRITL